MWQKKCRLTRADKCCMGGGGAPQRNFNQEWPSIKNFENKEFGQLDKYFRTEPLLSGSRDAALSGLADIPALQSELRGYQHDISGYQGPLKDIMSFLDPILKSGGELSPALSRDVTQSTRAGFAARGNVGGNQAIGGELLNREKYRNQRFDIATQEALGVTGELAGLTGQQAGLTAERQNVVSRAIQPALATQQTAVGTFAQLVDPVLQYLSNLFAGNQQAQVASQQASQGKTSGAIGGGISAIGTIAAAAL